MTDAEQGERNPLSQQLGRVWAVVSPHGSVVFSSFSKSARLAWQRLGLCKTLAQRERMRATGWTVRKCTVLVEPDQFGKSSTRSK